MCDITRITCQSLGKVDRDSINLALGLLSLEDIENFEFINQRIDHLWNLFCKEIGFIEEISLLM